MATAIAVSPAMSGDEGFVAIISAALGLVALVRWHYFAHVLGRGTARELALAIVPSAALVLLFVVLKNFASWDVRDSGTYLSMYMAMGAGWFGITTALMPMLGFSARDDALERRNSGAAWLVGGAALGFMFCFAGGNIGDGPGWWVVVFAAGLAAGTLCVLWVALNSVTHVADRVTIDRDAASGVRAGAFFLFAGLILGRAVAGNWVSLQQTILDFAERGWPAVLVAIFATGCEAFFKPDYQRERALSFTEAWLPAIGMAIIATVTLVVQGGFK